MHNIGIVYRLFTTHRIPYTQIRYEKEREEKSQAHTKIRSSRWILKCDLLPPEMVAERGRKRPIIQQMDFIVEDSLVSGSLFSTLFHQIFRVSVHLLLFGNAS